MTKLFISLREGCDELHGSRTGQIGSIMVGETQTLTNARESTGKSELPVPRALF